MASGLFSISCSASKELTQAHEKIISVGKLKGTWKLINIRYRKSFRVKPFDEGIDAKCFVGSIWKLIPNNYTGFYSLNHANDCLVFTRQIRFEIINGNQFRFKKLIEGQKAKNISTGYVLNLVNQTPSSFTLEQDIVFDGEIVKINYSFQKVN